MERVEPGGGGTGDISGVAAGTGLSGGGTSGDVTLSVNPAQTQTRVAGTCGAGSAIASIAQAGTVGCNAFPASLPPNGNAGGDLTGTYPNPTIKGNAVNSATVADNSLTGSDVDEASLDLGVGRSAVGPPGGIACSNEPSNDCAKVTLNLPRPSRVLLIGSPEAVDQSASGNLGFCYFKVGGQAMSAYGRTLGDAEGAHYSSATRYPQEVSLTMVTDVLAAGNHTIALHCEGPGGGFFSGMEFFNSQISAVALDDS